MTHSDIFILISGVDNVFTIYILLWFVECYVTYFYMDAYSTGFGWIWYWRSTSVVRINDINTLKVQRSVKKLFINQYKYPIL